MYFPNVLAALQRFESWRVTLGQALFSFLAIVLVRYQLEMALEASHTVALSPDLRTTVGDLLHVLVSWAVLYALLALGLAVCSGRGQARANRMALAGLPLIWLPPIFDFIFGTSGAIRYQHDFTHFVSSFMGLFNPAVTVSYVTPGVRVEIACGVSLSVLYIVILKPGAWGWVRGFLAGAWTYCVVFLLGFLPALWFFVLEQDHATLMGQAVLQPSDAAAALFWYLPLLLLIGPIWLRASSPSLWAALLASLRPSRVLVYMAICNLAFLSATRIGLVGWDWLNVYDVAKVLVLNLAIVLAFVAMAILNDLYDYDIDTLTNPHRPLQTGLVSKSDFALLGRTCGTLALALALAVNEVAAIPLAITMVLGYLYSAPPFRLRRFVGIAHLVLMAIVAAVYLYGATPVLGNLAFQQINKDQLLALMVLFFFASHIKDIKDEAGDRLAGVTTLATLLGASRAYWVIGGAISVFFLVMMWAQLLPNRVEAWLSIAVFVAAWAWLRNSERLIWVMLFAMGVLFLRW